jgi:hypothetical protein
VNHYPAPRASPALEPCLMDSMTHSDAAALIVLISALGHLWSYYYG